MRILVTGAAGFIGYHLTKRLLELDYEVVGIDNINNYYDINLKFDRLAQLGIVKADIFENNIVLSKSFKNFSFVKMDLIDARTMEEIFKKNNFNYVINLAAQAGVRYSLENPHTYIQSNIVGFMNVLECCRNFNIQHLVYASSSSVYGANSKIPFSEDDQVDTPVSLYAATKKSNELMAYTYSHLYKLPTTGLRFFTVYGPWGRPDMSPMLFADAILNNRPINIFNNGDMSRDFTYVDDIVEGIIKITEHIPQIVVEKPPYEIYNIGNNKPTKLMDFISHLEENLGLEAKKKYLPMQLGDVQQTWADTNLLVNIVNYKPSTTIDIGVKEFVNWYKKYYQFN
jgi:UDP-glucuronate 4-epimerase